MSLHTGSLYKRVVISVRWVLVLLLTKSKVSKREVSEASIFFHLLLSGYRIDTMVSSGPPY
jgi:hypothetical protein